MLNEAQCIIVCFVLFAYCICAESGKGGGGYCLFSGLCMIKHVRMD